MTREELRDYVQELRNLDIIPYHVYSTLIDGIDTLELQPEDAISRYSVLHKIAEFFSNWDGDENAKMEISVNDMREIASVYIKKARLEHQLKEIRQELCGNEVEP